MEEINDLVWVVDRTFEDVRFVAQDTLDTGKLPPHKGALNYQDLNRIYNNLKVLSKYLELLGNIINLDLVKTNWQMEDLPYLEDINDLRDTINYLKKTFKIGSDYGQIRYWDTLNFEDVNLLERFGQLIGQLIIQTMEQQLYCGEFFCGE